MTKERSSRAQAGPDRMDWPFRPPHSEPVKRAVRGSIADIPYVYGVHHTALSRRCSFFPGPRTHLSLGNALEHIQDATGCIMTQRL